MARLRDDGEFSQLRCALCGTRPQVKALACQLPAESGAPLSRWSAPELAGEVVARAIAGAISASTVRRWLKQDALKLWQYQSWIFITNPAFRTRAERVLGLYARTWNGEALGADEKTAIQARCRCHPTLAPGQARAMRVNHTYGRGGALAYGNRSPYLRTPPPLRRLRTGRSGRMTSHISSVRLDGQHGPLTASELSHWHTPRDHSGAVAVPGEQIAAVTCLA
ncbi:hypothetical protein ACIRRI_54450 [Streptomyces mirabilis]|uniref:hypothetical protein n=1 Tax=Streptomyces mirabilis TaxID=68239 RepID=UPI0037F5E075